MFDLLQPLRPFADQLSRVAEPVIVALGTAGVTGGLLAALALLADHVLVRAMPARIGR